ncbi:uncharacterized protein B0I36DRAFT_396340 [Microdochium trichocladiopsis]|uniref:DNA2/NAM7 helicase-like C-terminal domain-containing protein n=1 Tax=Microdochium trichocladiopsis TaxID=1682393 RepID=A0A9P9BJ08_9PEZI|nr:uncharacterized protein B0I36DRAFT_396340 [Microdochium trichocladiopsis]KAH7016238.1 hypothetical protein B0I36DRAFT_396340 [Microdochium trichocladiopsis]
MPRTRTCKQAVLVGDDIQLRLAVQAITTILAYDVSSFERLYDCCSDVEAAGQMPPNTQADLSAAADHYTKQSTLPRGSAITGLEEEIEVSTIDGYQGRDVEIVVLVTVRCTEHGEIRFLGDLRRMNMPLDES